MIPRHEPAPGTTPPDGRQTLVIRDIAGRVQSVTWSDEFRAFGRIGWK